MQNKKNDFQKNKKINKQHFNKKNNKYPYPYKKNNKYPYPYKKNNKYSYPYKKNNKYSSYKNKNNIYYLLGEKKPSKPLTTAYLHKNKKIKTGIFFKEPTFKTVLYPFYLNLKLINEYLKKK